MSCLSSYKRWISEDKPQYGFKHENNKKCQLYYDQYHNHIEFLGNNTYSFCIQIYDSPEGDTWWFGKFKELNGGTDIELIEFDYNRN